MCIRDSGYVDAENALVSEAFEGAGEGEDFMAGKCPIVMAYWGAANTDTAYGLSLIHILLRRS